MIQQNSIKIFVAMPGTDMGINASYKNPETVKANLLVPVVEKLKNKLQKEIILEIEKDKRESGVIHASMFAEAQNADIYIADLTGANPNVYLELGVRWSLKDSVTILISQNVEDLKFNVFANRAILYYPDIIIKAIDDVSEAIENGLKNSKCDSPVRLNSDKVIISKKELEKLNLEIQRLKITRGEDLLRAAEGTDQDNITDKISLLRKAIEANPALVIAYLKLGVIYRELSEYQNSIDALRRAVTLSPSNFELHRELGVTYSKLNKSELAVSSLRESVRLNPKDAESWSNLGGALRRIAMYNAPDSYDKKALQESRDSYYKAHLLNEYELYFILNVHRIDLLLSKWEHDRARNAKEGFKENIFLCKHEVQKKKNQNNYWIRFDLADTLLFSGNYTEAQKAYDEALSIIPKKKLKDTVSSVLGPLHNYQISGVLEGQLNLEVNKVVDRLENVIKGMGS